MPGKRKISIQEAFQTLKDAGIKVSVEQEEPPVLPPVEEVKPKKTRAKKGFRKVTLHSSHMIGSGGVKDEETGQIKSAGVMTYGPGDCEVPEELASQLLHQDQLAKQQDERMLDKTMRSYLVVQRRGTQGMSNVGVQVDSSLFGELGNVPPEYLHTF